jgi:tetratricopeptide (TPR) repeat protein
MCVRQQPKKDLNNDILVIELFIIFFIIMHHLSLFLVAALLGTMNVAVLPQKSSATEMGVIAIKQSGAVDYLRSGMRKYQEGDTQGALADYDQAIAIDPRFGMTYGVRGILKDEKLNDTQGALADFDKSISLSPNFALAYNYRAKLKANKLNDLKGALADYNRVIAINSREPGAYADRGAVKLKLKDRAGGVKDLKQAVRMYRKEGNVQKAQEITELLKKLGA